MSHSKRPKRQLHRSHTNVLRRLESVLGPQIPRKPPWSPEHPWKSLHVAIGLHSCALITKTQHVLSSHGPAFDPAVWQFGCCLLAVGCFGLLWPGRLVALLPEWLNAVRSCAAVIAATRQHATRQLPTPWGTSRNTAKKSLKVPWDIVML